MSHQQRGSTKEYVQEGIRAAGSIVDSGSSIDSSPYLSRRHSSRNRAQTSDAQQSSPKKEKDTSHISMKDYDLVKCSLCERTSQSEDLQTRNVKAAELRMIIGETLKNAQSDSHDMIDVSWQCRSHNGDRNRPVLGWIVFKPRASRPDSKLMALLHHYLATKSIVEMKTVETNVTGFSLYKTNLKVPVEDYFRVYEETMKKIIFWEELKHIYSRDQSFLPRAAKFQFSKMFVQKTTSVGTQYFQNLYLAHAHILAPASTLLKKLNYWCPPPPEYRPSGCHLTKTDINIDAFTHPTGFARHVSCADDLSRFLEIFFHCEQLGLMALNLNQLGVYYAKLKEGYKRKESLSTSSKDLELIQPFLQEIMARNPSLSKPAFIKNNLLGGLHMTRAMRISNKKETQPSKEAHEDPVWIKSDLIQVWIGGYIKGVSRNVTAIRRCLQTWGSSSEELDLAMETIWNLFEQVEVLYQYPGEIVYSGPARIPEGDDISDDRWEEEVFVQWHAVLGLSGKGFALAKNFFQDFRRNSAYALMEKLLSRFVDRPLRKDERNYVLKQNGILQGLAVTNDAFWILEHKDRFPNLVHFIESGADARYERTINNNIKMVAVGPKGSTPSCTCCSETLFLGYYDCQNFKEEVDKLALSYYVDKMFASSAVDDYIHRVGEDVELDNHLCAPCVTLLEKSIDNRIESAQRIDEQERAVTSNSQESAKKHSGSRIPAFGSKHTTVITLPGSSKGRGSTVVELSENLRARSSSSANSDDCEAVNSRTKRRSSALSVNPGKKRLRTKNPESGS